MTGETPANLDEEINGAVHRELSVWEETGGGDPRKRRLQYQMEAVLGGAVKIDQEYQPVQRDDINIFKLCTALNTIALASTYHRVEDYVSDALSRFGKVGAADRRNAAFRIYDSLGMLLNSYSFVLPDPQTGERSEEHVEQFTQENASSDMWSNTEWTEQMLESIAMSYALVGEITAHNPDSIKGYVTKMRLELIRQGFGWTIPKRGTPARARFENDLKKARPLAWADFKNSAGSLLPEAGR